ncbi:hypothetical protein, partial [Candidatus Entotheonella palauensis]|uniref:hypothetical protein n=1 Tax=Candidatus Entotheonella palauensis TaxID=93172 RepID=UPI001C4E055C
MHRSCPTPRGMAIQCATGCHPNASGLQAWNQQLLDEPDIFIADMIAQEHRQAGAFPSFRSGFEQSQVRS